MPTDPKSTKPKEILMNARFLAASFASLLTVSVAAGALSAVLFLCATSTVHAAGGHDHSPKHGGVVAEANDLDFELVARPDRLTLHVRDHGKPLPVQGASARLTLLTGTERAEAVLAPVGTGSGLPWSRTCNVSRSAMTGSSRRGPSSLARGPR
jgi:hypothetical protein